MDRYDFATIFFLCAVAIIAICGIGALARAYLIDHAPLVENPRDGTWH